MVRTPSGHSPSQSRSPSASGARSRVLEPGDELGPRFLIDDLLGEGGMGRVYKATDRELGRVIAIKVLLSELTNDAQVIQRFKHELLLASRISHKHILRIHDLSEADGVKFITMAYVEGKDLNQVLKTESPLPLERCLKFARQLCEALAAAHAEGVVHRDFKPHNVLVAKDDQVYVSDFGLATSFETAKMGMTRSVARHNERMAYVGHWKCRKCQCSTDPRAAVAGESRRREQGGGAGRKSRAGGRGT